MNQREQFEEWAKASPRYWGVELEPNGEYIIGVQMAWEAWQAARQVTPQMIEDGAQALLSWEEGCIWPDSWEPYADRHRKDAEKCFRAMIGGYL